MWQFLTFLVVAAIGSLLYIDQKYDTSRPCEALSEIIVEEMPGAIDDIGERRFQIRLGKVVGRMIEPNDKFVRETAHDFLFRNVSQTDQLECMGMVFAADINRDWFRGKLADRLEDEIERRL